MRFAALGRTRWLYDSIKSCADAGHEPVLIGTAPAAPEYGADEADFAKLAEELGCPFFDGGELEEEKLRSANAEIAISINWPTVLGPSVLELFARGIVNAHAGDLPRYRGNAAPNWAILEGEPAVTLTLHEMSPDLDAGPVLLKRNFELTPETYIGDLYAEFDRALPEMFAEVLTGLESGEIEPQPQPDDPEQSLRGHPRAPEDGRIDWSLPAEQLGRLVRASAEPFAGAYSYLDGSKAVIWRARPEPHPAPLLAEPGQVLEVRGDAGEIAVMTGDGRLVAEEIEIEGTERRPAAEAVRSTRKRFSSELAARVEELERRLEER